MSFSVSRNLEESCLILVDKKKCGFLNLINFLKDLQNNKQFTLIISKTSNRKQELINYFQTILH